MEFLSKVLILELKRWYMMNLQHSGLCQDQYAVCPWRIRRIQHLKTISTRLQTNTAYYPQQYAVSRFKFSLLRYYIQYAIWRYPIRRIQDLNVYSRRIQDIKRGPYSKSDINTAYWLSQYGVLTSQTDNYINSSSRRFQREHNPNSETLTPRSRFSKP